MPYLIDGHNLAAKTPGISLDQVDDELALIELLESFFKHIHKRAEVYFDNAAPGQKRILRRAFLTAYFIPKPGDADQAIIMRLKRLGGEAHNYSVVTSDQWISSQAARYGAHVISSSDFARSLSGSISGDRKEPDDPDQNVDYWMEVFK